MAAETHSFIDIAALDGVRGHFAAGDAVVILTTDLGQVIWCNGPGAALLGFSGIESAIGAESGLSRTARRQIEAVPGFPEVGTEKPIAVRLAAGMISQITPLRASSLALPGGEAAIMLVSPATGAVSQDVGKAAAHAIGGFEEPGNYVALLGADAETLAATPGFERLGLGRAALDKLVADAASERVLKRIVRAEGRAMPVGFARLAEQPARYLLITVDEETAELEEDRPAAAPIASVDDSQSAVGGVPDSASEIAASAGGKAAPTGEDVRAEIASEIATVVATIPAPAEDEELASPADAEGATHPDVSSAMPPHPDVPDLMPPVDARQEAAAPQGSQHDSWYFSDRAPAQRPSGTEPASETGKPGPTERAPLAEGRRAAPVRFIWRTDAEGRFSAISPEFIAVVGAEAGDVVGRGFAEIAARLALDPDGEIAGLLERRDTWSGRSVLWPVAGTDLRVPVDLAALPAYGRERQFEGFRGFGVVRAGEAVVDPEAIGLSLVQPQAAPGADATGPAESDAPVQAENQAAPAEGATADPFKGEVPVLEIAPKPQRRYSDKVIRLAEHRAPANDKGLTPVERSAFHEIGEQLKRASQLSDIEKESTSKATDQAERDTPRDEVRPAASEEAAAARHDATVGQAPDATVSSPSREVVAATDAPEWRTPPSVPAAPVPANEAQKPSAGHGTPAYGKAREDDDAAEQGVIASLETEDQAPPPSDQTGVDTAAEDTVAPETEGRPEAAPDGEMAAQEASAVTAEDRKSRSLLDFAASESEAAAAEAAPGAVRDPPDAAAPVADAVSRDIQPADQQPAAPVQAEQADIEARPAEQAPAQAAAAQPIAPPPLKQDGFLPSAFAERRRADTSILAQLPIPVLIHAGDTLHYANDAFFQLTGYESLGQFGEAGGLDVLLSGPAADRSDGDNRVMLRTRAGEEFPVSAFLQSVPWLGGKALLLTLSRQPAAAASAAVTSSSEEQELRARIAELRTILDTATDGVVLIGNDGMVRSISRPAEALFGYDSDQLVGKPFTSLFAIESQRSARDYLAGLSEHGVASVLNDGREVIGREAQGRFIPLFMTIGRLPGNGGYCAVLRDITQWKRAEEELTQARAQAERTSTQKSDFLARVSHEIRTPLNAIIGFSELMLDEKFGPVSNDRYRDYLRDINRSGNHVLDLVNDLLDISKIEAGQQEMQYEAVALNEALAETVAMMQPQANRERVIIRSSFASKLPEVVADLRSVRQIALNILSNAVRYTQAGGQVIVSTSHEPNGEVVMRVRDTGIGMTQAEIEQALKPFKQVNALRRARGDGTGLGLPLTKAMVEANRAKFAIYSTPGEGTLVEVSFPSTRVLAE